MGRRPQFVVGSGCRVIPGIGPSITQRTTDPLPWAPIALRAYACREAAARRGRPGDDRRDMSQLKVEINAERRDGVVPGEFGVVATFANESNTVARLNTAQAKHPALVLEIEDEQGKAVLMRPPDVPREDEGGPGEPLDPGATVRIEYVGFLDRSQAPGRYRVRYLGQFEPLGGSREDPLVSDWLDFEVAEPSEKFDVAEPLPARGIVSEPVGLLAFWDWLKNWWHNLICMILRLIGRDRCNQVFTRNVDEARTEIMSDAPPGFEAWNGTYSWRARFRVRVDQNACQVMVTIRVRLVGTISAAQRTAWENAIEAAWSNVFKFCCRCCCCRNGYTIVANIEFVSSGEDQVVNVGNTTTNMGNWGRNDTTAVSHEFGHMLGALDEYYTVDGTAWGMPFQAGAGIMNNPNEGPLARHFGVVELAVEAALGTSCATRAVAASC